MYIYIHIYMYVHIYFGLFGEDTGLFCGHIKASQSCFSAHPCVLWSVRALLRRYRPLLRRYRALLWGYTSLWRTCKSIQAKVL